MINPLLHFAEIVDALPLRSRMRVWRSGAPRTAAREIKDGRLSARCVAVEDFELTEGERPYDLAFAVRVGALDGRHARAMALALPRLRAALVPGAKLMVDGGAPLREVPPRTSDEFRRPPGSQSPLGSMDGAVPRQTLDSGAHATGLSGGKGGSSLRDAGQDRGPFRRGCCEREPRRRRLWRDTR